VPEAVRSANPPSSTARITPSALLTILKVSRPAGWLIAAGVFRVGMGYGGAIESPRTIALTAALTLPFCLFLFGLNDLADAGSDRDNPRKGGWVHGGRVEEPTLAPVRIAVGIAGLGMLGLMPWLDAAGRCLLAGLLGLAWMYSTPPVRLKEIPVIDGLASAAILGGLLALGFVQGSALVDLPPEPFVFVPAMVGLHIFASVMDHPSDAQAKHRTLPVRIGPRAAAGVALGITLLTVGSIPVMSFAPQIAIVAVIQALAIALYLALPRRVTARRAFVGIGLSSGAAMAHLLFFYL
jgi:4-hydroxybenzoate polyprenyltransferase